MLPLPSQTRLPRMYGLCTSKLHFYYSHTNDHFSQMGVKYNALHIMTFVTE